jgi:hypothetical protein
MEIKNLINHNTFVLGKTPHKDEFIIPFKLVLKQGNMEKQRIKRTRATVQKRIQKQRQENAEDNPTTTKTNTIPIEIPQPFEDTWSPCASSRGVKLLISTTCAAHRTLKSGDFIGANLQAKVIGRHFVGLPLEYAYYFPKYVYFGTPYLLNKGISLFWKILEH